MKFLLILFVIFTVAFPANSVAQTKTPTNSAIPTSDEIQKINAKVDELKDKVASRVAQLKLVERRGTIGTVESVSDTQITVNDLNNKRRIIDVDELTKFSSNENDSFGISDIKKGSKISSIGLYNKESQRLLARFVNEISIPLFLHGVISAKDEDEFTITLSTEDGTNYIIDFEKITKSFVYSEGELNDSGFTKIQIDQNAIISGYTDPDEENRVTASRIITFTDLPKNPKIQVVPDLSPSSAKITPKKDE